MSGRRQWPLSSPPSSALARCPSGSRLGARLERKGRSRVSIFSSGNSNAMNIRKVAVIHPTADWTKFWPRGVAWPSKCDAYWLYTFYSTATDLYISWSAFYFLCSVGAPYKFIFYLIVSYSLVTRNLWKTLKERSAHPIPIISAPTKYDTWWPIRHFSHC